jgi:hypothetical protein
MKKLLLAISFLGLALVIGPSLAYLAGTAGKDTMTNLMMLGTLLWFVSVPLWMGRESQESRIA